MTSLLPGLHSQDKRFNPGTSKFPHFWKPWGVPVFFRGPLVVALLLAEKSGMHRSVRFVYAGQQHARLLANEQLGQICS